jgi:hypothetical protein
LKEEGYTSTRATPEFIVGQINFAFGKGVFNSHDREAPMTKPKGHKVGRDAKDGRFITVQEARRRPSTTIVQIIRNPPHHRKK